VTTSRHLAMAALLALSSTCAGCKSKYSDPGARDGVTSQLLAARPGDTGTNVGVGRAFYPLAVGNRWDYRIHMTSVIITDAGPQPPVGVEAALAAEIAGTQQVGDQTYFLQTEFDPTLVPPPVAVAFRERQDRLGLFELDESGPTSDLTLDGPAPDPTSSDLAVYVDRTIVDPAQRAAFRRAAAEVAAKLALVRRGGVRSRPNTGAGPGEITMLSYPLVPGVSWIVRDSPRFARVVVGRDRVTVPLGTFTAWKIRGTSEVFGPDDRVHFWYSDLGLLSIRLHVVANATDPFGNVIGRVETDFDQSLSSIHLQGHDPVLAAGE